MAKGHYWLLVLATLYAANCGWVDCCGNIVGIQDLENLNDEVGSEELNNDLPIYRVESRADKFPKKNESKSPASFYRSALSGRTHRDNGWPLIPVVFDHPIQSPVDLITYKSVFMDLPVLEIVEPLIPGARATLYNTGTTVYVYIKENPSNRPFLKGGPLKEKFIFEQMHFHWGSEDIWGSEHLIDGESYAVEIHMVHFNSKYSTFQRAVKMQDGLAVLTVFAEAVDTTNRLLEPLDELLTNITQPGNRVKLDSNEAMQWTSSALTTNSMYYTYPGSLTTPPYSENVVFILLPEPVTLSHSQLSAFRGLYNKQGGHILENKRQLQPLHNRPIVRSQGLP